VKQCKTTASLLDNACIMHIFIDKTSSKVPSVMMQIYANLRTQSCDFDPWPDDNKGSCKWFWSLLYILSCWQNRHTNIHTHKGIAI